MTIETTRDNRAASLIITGRVDTVTSPELEELIEHGLDDVTDLTLDFAGVDYISSAGLRVLLRAQKRMNECGSMKLINVKPIVNEIFEITGFNEILIIE